MVTKGGFCQIIDLILKMENTVSEFQKVVDKTGILVDTNLIPGYPITTLLDFLKEEMNDKDDFITWWLYDCPQMGKAHKKSCYTVTFEEKGKKKKWVLKNKENLYDYLVEEYSETRE